MSYCSEKLKEYFVSAQRKNSNYSLRALSRDIGINPGTLSAIFSFKRPIPERRLKRVMLVMRLTPKQKSRFLREYQSHRIEIKAAKILSGDFEFDAFEGEQQKLLDDQTEMADRKELLFHIIAEWEHFAVLSLMNCMDFKSDSAWMSQRLNVPQARIDLVLKRLIELGLVVRNKTGKLSRQQVDFKTTEDVWSVALQKAHEEELDLAKMKLFSTDLKLRNFSSVTMAISPAKIGLAKDKIRQFQNEMSALLEDETATEVYQLSIQFCPLTIFRGTLEENASIKGETKDDLS